MKPMGLRARLDAHLRRFRQQAQAALAMICATTVLLAYGPHRNSAEVTDPAGLASGRIRPDSRRTGMAT
jgi:hypothetical protein